MSYINGSFKNLNTQNSFYSLTHTAMFCVCHTRGIMAVLIFKSFRYISTKSSNNNADMLVNPSPANALNTKFKYSKKQQDTIWSTRTTWTTDFSQKSSFFLWFGERFTGAGEIDRQTNSLIYRVTDRQKEEEEGKCIFRGQTNEHLGQKDL